MGQQWLQPLARTAGLEGAVALSLALKMGRADRVGTLEQDTLKTDWLL